MKNVTKKLIALLLVLAVAFISPLASAQKTPEAVAATSYLKEKMTLTIGKYNEYYKLTEEQLNGAKVKKVTSSNKKVAIGEKWNNSGISLYLNKVGKTNITVTLTDGNTVESKITVKKNVLYVKKFTIGSTNLIKKFENLQAEYGWVEYKAKSKKEKIVVTPKKGWKVKSIKFEWGGKTTDDYHKQTVKSGQYITVPSYSNSSILFGPFLTVKVKKGSQTKKLVVFVVAL